MKYTILLVSTILISSCGTIQTKGIPNNANMTQLEKDIASCEEGKPLYSSCTPYSGFRDEYNYDNYNFNSSWKDNWKSGGVSFSSEWVDKCPEGESKIFLNLFGAKTYVRHQDIKQCMNEKGYSYKAPKWIKNKINSVFVNGKYIKAESYLNRVLTPKDESIPETDKPFWEIRAYPQSSCYPKYDFIYCNQKGTFYEGKGTFIKGMYYPKSVIDNLFQAGYTISDIEQHSPVDINKETLNTPVKTQKQNINQDISYIESLKRAKDLFNNGVISLEEFESIKTKIIDEM